MTEIAPLLTYDGSFFHPDAERQFEDYIFQQQERKLDGESDHSSALDQQLEALCYSIRDIGLEADIDLRKRLPPLTAFRFFKTRSDFDAGLAQRGNEAERAVGFCDDANVYVLQKPNEIMDTETWGVVAHELGHLISNKTIRYERDGSFIPTYDGFQQLEKGELDGHMLNESFVELMRIDQMQRWKDAPELQEHATEAHKVPYGYVGVVALAELIGSVAHTNQEDPRALYGRFLRGHLLSDLTVISDVKNSLPQNYHDAYDAFLESDPESRKSIAQVAERLGLKNTVQVMHSDSNEALQRLFEWV